MLSILPGTATAKDPFAPCTKQSPRSWEKGWEREKLGTEARHGADVKLGEQQNVTDTGELSWHSQSRAVPHDCAASKGRSYYQPQPLQLLKTGIMTWLFFKSLLPQQFCW